VINPKLATAFIARLLHGVTMAHMHHLMVVGQGAYAKHMALGELYEGLQDKTDALAESLIGCADVSLAFAGGTFTLGDNPVADVAELYNFVEGSRLAVGTESHIQNQVDEICSVLATALYKLRRLQ